MWIVFINSPYKRKRRQIANSIRFHVKLCEPKILFMWDEERKSTNNPPYVASHRRKKDYLHEGWHFGGLCIQRILISTPPAEADEQKEKAGQQQSWI